MMDVTLFADASVNPQHKSSGWGFWIKGDGRDSMTAGGPLKRYTPSTSVAELEALANGLECASASGYFRVSDASVMLQCDNSEALGCLIRMRPSIAEKKHENGASIPRRRKALDTRQEAAARHILEVLDRHGLTATVRHVRGHKQGGGRNWVNRLCDRLAKEGAKAARRSATKVAA